MKKLGVSVMVSLLILTVVVVGSAVADQKPFIDTPYKDGVPLTKYYTRYSGQKAFSNENIPDGQLHWLDDRIPGIDLKKKSDVAVILYSPCPNGGLAYSPSKGDPWNVGSGSALYVLVECQGMPEGQSIKVILFHLEKVLIPYDRAFPVKYGDVLGLEGNHTHLSVQVPKDFKDCPTYFASGRYWINAATCSLVSPKPSVDMEISDAVDASFELYLLEWKYWLAGLSWVLILLVGWKLHSINASLAGKGPPASDFFISTFVVSIFVLGLSVAPIWPTEFVKVQSSSVPQNFELAGNDLHMDPQLLQGFYAAGVARGKDGKPSKDPKDPIFPASYAAAIPWGETNVEPWGSVDMTKSGPWGRCLAEVEIVKRWPVSTLEWVSRRPISTTAEKQIAGLKAVAENMSLKGKKVLSSQIYGSCGAGAIGRTQILPGYFAKGALCGDLTSKDMWNDPFAVGECTTRHLVVSGCWGSWISTQDVWSSLCAYNPGAWNVPKHQWYWDTLRRNQKLIKAVETKYDLTQKIYPITTVNTGAGGNLADTKFVSIPAQLHTMIKQMRADEKDENRIQILSVGFRVTRFWLLLYGQQPPN